MARAGKLSFYAPRLSIASFLLCLVSGTILTSQYHPFGNVFQNVEEITTGVPYGFFFRRLHYASGELFAILLLVHFFDHFLKHRYTRYSPGTWARIVFPVVISFFILFTGYILKGDKEGIYAGNIFLNLLQDIPLCGESLSRFFISPGESFFWLPYLYHCLFLPVLLALLVNGHVKSWRPDGNVLLFTAAVLFVWALFVDMPMDVPPSARIELVKGPWFFLGLQACLRVLPPFLAEVAFPSLLLTLVLVLPLLTGRGRIIGHYTIVLSLLAYGSLVVFGYFFMGTDWFIS